MMNLFPCGVFLLEVQLAAGDSAVCAQCVVVSYARVWDSALD